jgi:hypothetical protein
MLDGPAQAVPSFFVFVPRHRLKNLRNGFSVSGQQL